jgi:hypothetical protein
MNTLSNEPQKSNDDEAGVPFGHHNYQDNVPVMSPWFPADEYRPMMAGPFECKAAGPFAKPEGEEEPKHMRWWDGEHWSYPLQPDHQDWEGNYFCPESAYFVRRDLDEYLKNFAWRGFNEDQEPL